MALIYCPLGPQANHDIGSLGPRPNGRSCGWTTSPLRVSRRSGDVIHPQLRPLGLGPRLDIGVYHRIWLCSHSCVPTAKLPIFQSPNLYFKLSTTHITRTQLQSHGTQYNKRLVLLRLALSLLNAHARRPYSLCSTFK